MAPEYEADPSKPPTHEAEDAAVTEVVYSVASRIQKFEGGTLEEELRVYETEFQDAKAMGKKPVAVLAFLGSPSAGKDWFTKFIGWPFLTHTLHIKNASLRHWEDAEIELRQEGKIKTPPDQSFTRHELSLSFQRQKRLQTLDLLCGIEGLVSEYPAGTALEYALEYGINKQIWFETRKFGDRMPQHMFNILNHFDPTLLDRMNYLQIELLRGPWMDILEWYRQFILDSRTLSEGDYYNYMFGFAPFDSLEAMQSLQNGSSAPMVETSQSAMNTIVEYATHKIENIPQVIVDPYREDMERISKILEIHPRFYNRRVRYNLGLKYVYDRNAKVVDTYVPKKPQHYRRVAVVNNPELILPEEDVLQILIRLKKSDLGMIKTLSEEDYRKGIEIVGASKANYYSKYPAA